MEKISVIIPCYNVEKLVGRCVESLLHQTIGVESLELIFVDDASTDATFEVLMGYEKKNPEHICVVSYSENLRQGGARNVGLSYATGDYIGFVDADDWIEPDMYETLLNGLKKYDCDMAFCDIDYGGPVVGIEQSSRNRSEKIFSAADYDEEYPFFLDDKYPSSGIVTKLFKREVIMESGVHFPEKLAYEDNYWGALISLYIKKVVYIPYPFYHYVIHAESTVQKKDSLHQLDRLQIELMKLEEFKKRGLMEKYHDRIEASFMQLFYFNTLHILFTKFENIPDIFYAMKDAVLTEFPKVEKNPILQKNMTPVEREELRWLRIPQRISPRDLERFAENYRQICKKEYEEKCIAYSRQQSKEKKIR